MSWPARMERSDGEVIDPNQSDASFGQVFRPAGVDRYKTCVKLVVLLGPLVGVAGSKQKPPGARGDFRIFENSAGDEIHFIWQVQHISPAGQGFERKLLDCGFILIQKMVRGIQVSAGVDG